MNSPADTAIQEALALHRQGNLRSALDHYNAILRADPDNADALYYVAMIAMQQSRFTDGIELAERALKAGPQARVHNMLGQAFIRMQEPAKALAAFDRALAADPGHADGHGNRANVLADLDRFDEALQGFDRALALRPDAPVDWCNRAAALQDLDRFEEALASCERAIALQPDLAMAHYNRANVLRDLGQMEDAAGQPQSGKLDAALAAYGKAIELDPQFAASYLGRGIVHLLRGDWSQGWRDYEYRTRAGAPAFTPLPGPRWMGEPLTGERLVIITEQGLGDALFFCRFAPLLAACGFDVTILAKRGLVPLLAALPGVKVTTSADGLTEPLRWIPMMSLPDALGIRPDSVPAAVPYLKAEPQRIDLWASRLRGGFKVGINWSAGHLGDRRRRNLSLAALAPLAAIPGVRLISLQKGPPSAEITQAPFPVETVGTDPDSATDLFRDTAAVMTQLHAIVTCDTSVTHLAGALARPVFVALPAIADWRWMLGRDDSPWYPTLRLFRQSTLGDWDGVCARIAAAVGDLAVKARRA